jgi:hypothetical protein
MAQIMKVLYGVPGMGKNSTVFISNTQIIKVEKAGRVTRLRHFDKARTYKEWRKIFSEMVREHRKRCTSHGGGGQMVR